MQTSRLILPCHSPPITTTQSDLILCAQIRFWVSKVVLKGKKTLGMTRINSWALCLWKRIFSFHTSQTRCIWVEEPDLLILNLRLLSWFQTRLCRRVERRAIVYQVLKCQKPRKFRWAPVLASTKLELVSEEFCRIMQKKGLEMQHLYLRGLSRICARQPMCTIKTQIRQDKFTIYLYHTNQCRGVVWIQHRQIIWVPHDKPNSLQV